MTSWHRGAAVTRGGFVLALMAAPAAALAQPHGNPLTSTTAGHAHHHAWDMLVSVTTGVPAAGLGVLLVAAVSLGLAWALRRHHHAWPVALAVVVASGAFESSVHSVHHLDDPDGAAKCAVAAASAHSDGVSAESRSIPAPEIVLHDAAPACPDILRVDSLRGIPDGRAPPLRSST